MAFAHQTINNGDHPVDGPTVHKPAIGTNGDRMELVDVNEAVSPQIARRRAFLQQFLDTDAERPFDVRVYVVDDHIVGAMKRYAPADEWRTNVALGGDVEGISDDLPEDPARLAIEATTVLDLDYAGVDLLRRDDTWYVLEVNATAGFKGFFESTGVSPAPYIARLAIERAEGRVESERVAELATTLDDSVPDCKPSIGSKPETPETVGYTEHVAVSGRRKIEYAVAKSDTGAQRTSIDIDLAAAVGAGPIVDTTRVKSGTRNGRQKRVHSWTSRSNSAIGGTPRRPASRTEATRAIPCFWDGTSCEATTWISNNGWPKNDVRVLPCIPCHARNTSNTPTRAAWTIRRSRSTVADLGHRVRRRRAREWRRTYPPLGTPSEFGKTSQTNRRHSSTARTRRPPQRQRTTELPQ